MPASYDYEEGLPRGSQKEIDEALRKTFASPKYGGGKSLRKRTDTNARKQKNKLRELPTLEMARALYRRLADEHRAKESRARAKRYREGKGN